MESGEWKQNGETTPHCPRCGSCNTKFCYYNNYSLTQPRYFCKGCRRYWTKGGSLRNVPVGGGCRKSRRGKSVRLSSDRIGSRVFGYGSGPVQPSGYGDNTMVELEPTHGSNVPNIDLAQVYANFLSQPLGTLKGPTQPERADDSGSPSFHFGMIPDMHTDFNCSLPFGNELVEHDATLQHRSSETGADECDAIFLPELNLIPKQHEPFQQFTSDCDHPMINNHGLPPLPGEEGLWPDSREIVAHNSMQLSAIEPGGMTSGDLPDYGMFFRH